jgi:hypothetical protein
MMRTLAANMNRPRLLLLACACAAALAGGMLAAQAARGAERSGARRAQGSASAAAAVPAAAADVPAATRARLEAHLAFLADDLLKGRFTGTPEYEIAARYVAAQLQQLGLRPGSAQGYLLRVPFLASHLEPGSGRLELVVAGERRELRWLEHYVLGPELAVESLDVEAPLVFVGHGVVAPGRGWDDYAGLDVRGKIAVVLSGAPASFPSEERAFHSKGFRKEQVAAEHGAVAMLGIRSPVDVQRRPWQRYTMNAGKRPSMDWLGPDGRPHHATSVQGSATLSQGAAAEVFAAVGRKADEVIAAATERPGSGFELAASARLASRSRHTRLESSNVAAVLPGSDPALAGETVVYSAHLDHVGLGEEVDGDGIYNGFYDNAMGVALMLETARALAAAPQRPRRGVVFLAVTGEERGLLGSAHFAHHPPPEAGTMVANVNLDMPVFMERADAVVAFGAEHSSLQPLVERAAGAAGFRIMPDPIPEEVIFVRSDQYSFVEVGIPAVYLVPGLGARARRGNGGAQSERSDFQEHHYHMPSDELGLPVDWPSALRFLDANVRLGREIADAPARPTWNEGDFFGETFGAR